MVVSAAEAPAVSTEGRVLRTPGASLRLQGASAETGQDPARPVGTAVCAAAAAALPRGF